MEMCLFLTMAVYCRALGKDSFLCSANSIKSGIGDSKLAKYCFATQLKRNIRKIKTLITVVQLESKFFLKGEQIYI